MRKTITALTIAATLTGTALLTITPAHANPQDDRLFYALVTGDAPAFKAIPRRELIKTARQTCKGLRQGLTIIETHDLMTESGFTDTQASAFLAGAVVFYCPDQKNNY